MNADDLKRDIQRSIDKFAYSYSDRNNFMIYDYQKDKVIQFDYHNLPRSWSYN